MDSRRIKYIDVSAQVIADICKMATKDALPDDAKILRVHYNELTHSFRLTVESKTFPEIPEASLIPKFGNPIISSGIFK